MREVHENEIAAQARAVLEFWFVQDSRRHWAKDTAFDDAEIAGAVRHETPDAPDTLRVASILIDPFSRKIHRDTAEAFAPWLHRRRTRVSQPA